MQKAARGTACTAELKEKIWSYFEPYREKREYYLNHKDEVRDILKSGAQKARNKAMPIIENTNCNGDNINVCR